MSAFHEWLLGKPKEELAKLLAAEAKKNATLEERVVRLEVELFWAKVALEKTDDPEKPYLR